MTEVARLTAAIEVTGVEKATRSLNEMGASVDKTGSLFSKLASPIGMATKALGSIGLAGMGISSVTSAVGGLGKALGIDFNAQMQQATIGFTTMLGSGEKAKGFLGDLQKFAAQTPFEFPDLVTASQRMLAMGTSAQDVIPRLTAIGNAAAALGGGKDVIDGVTTALGQMGAKGKVSAEEMGQLTERGIPAWQMLADKIGVTVPEAMKLAEKGAISADTAIGAITEGMQQRFGGMMEAQSKTFSGAMSTIKDSVNLAMGTAFQPLFALVSEGAVTLSTFLSGDQFASWSAAATGAIGSVIERLVAFGAEALPAVQAFAQAVGPPLLAAFQAVAAFVTGTLAPAMREFIASDVLPKVQAFGSFLTGTLVPAFQQLAASLSGPVAAAFETLKSGLAFLADHKEVVVALVAAFVTYQTTMAAATAATAAYQAAQKLATAAQIAFNAAASANPIGIVALALAGLVAGVILVVRHWDDLTARFPVLQRAADAVSGVLSSLGDRLADFGRMILPELVTAWEGLSSGVGRAIEGVRSVVEPVFAGIAGFLADHRAQIQTIIAAAWDFISGTVERATAVISNVVQLALNVIAGDWSGAWENVKAIGSAAWEQITALVRLGVDALPAILSLGMDAAKEAMRLAWEAIKKGVEDAWFLIKTAVTMEITAVASLIKGIPGAIGDVSRLLWQVGQDIVAGLKSGISAAWDGFTRWMGDLVDKLPGPVKTALGIGSPSRVFAEEVGVPIVQGIQAGIAMQAPALFGQMDALGAALVGRASAIVAEVGRQYATGGHGEGNKFLFDPMAHQGFGEKGTGGDAGYIGKAMDAMKPFHDMAQMNQHIANQLHLAAQDIAIGQLQWQSAQAQIATASGASGGSVAPWSVMSTADAIRANNELFGYGVRGQSFTPPRGNYPQPNVTVQVTVNPQPGQNEEQIAGHVVSAARRGALRGLGRYI